MPYASVAAACRTPWNLSRASYFIPIQVSGPEFMLKISAPRVHADPRLCCGDQNAIRTPPETEGNEKGGKQWAKSKGGKQWAINLSRRVYDGQQAIGVVQRYGPGLSDQPGCAASSYGSSVVLWRWPYDWRGQVGERD